MDLHNKVRRKSDICGVKDLIDERETKLTRLQHKMDKEEKERSEREVELTEKLAEAETRIVNLKRSIEGHNHNVSELIRTTQDELFNKMLELERQEKKGTALKDTVLRQKARARGGCCDDYVVDQNANLDRSLTEEERWDDKMFKKVKNELDKLREDVKKRRAKANKERYDAKCKLAQAENNKMFYESLLDSHVNECRWRRERQAVKMQKLNAEVAQLHAEENRRHTLRGNSPMPNPHH